MKSEKTKKRRMKIEKWKHPSKTERRGKSHRLALSENLLVRRAAQPTLQPREKKNIGKQYRGLSSTPPVARAVRQSWRHQRSIWGWMKTHEKPTALFSVVAHVPHALTTNGVTAGVEKRAAQGSRKHALFLSSSPFFFFARDHAASRKQNHWPASTRGVGH